MNILFDNEIIPRKLTIDEQIEFAKKVAKYELVEILLKKEQDIKTKYKKALFVEAKEEVEDYKVMMNIIDLALKYSLN